MIYYPTFKIVFKSRYIDISILLILISDDNHFFQMLHFFYSFNYELNYYYKKFLFKKIDTTNYIYVLSFFNILILIYWKFISLYKFCIMPFRIL